MEAIRTENLVKQYKDKTAVKGLDLTVHQGELYGLLGVNGAGRLYRPERRRQIHHHQNAVLPYPSY